MPYGFKTLGKSIMESSMCTVHNANDRRSSMLSDTTCPRPNMPTSEGLPQRWRLRTKKLAKIRVRFLTVNIGTMTGKSREVAEMLKRRRVVACVQETKWKGNKAREIGEGYKIYYVQWSINDQTWSWYHLT